MFPAPQIWGRTAFQCFYMILNLISLSSTKPAIWYHCGKLRLAIFIIFWHFIMIHYYLYLLLSTIFWSRPQNLNFQTGNGFHQFHFSTPQYLQFAWDSKSYVVDMSGFSHWFNSNSLMTLTVKGAHLKQSFKCVEAKAACKMSTYQKLCKEYKQKIIVNRQNDVKTPVWFLNSSLTNLVIMAVVEVIVSNPQLCSTFSPKNWIIFAVRRRKHHSDLKRHRQV